LSLLFAFLIGFFAGLRSLTPPAVAAWAVQLGWLKVQGPLAFMGSIYSAAIFTVLALGELAADKWAKINRTSLAPLITRILTGGLVGACIAVGGGENMTIGAALGAIGGIAGAFVSYQMRKRLVQTLRVPDFYIAVLEDLLVVAGCLWIVAR
jgi:uncharacterized membrane protein